eukprot:8449768-Pyramimonas_sp.AAC.2
MDSLAAAFCRRYELGPGALLGLAEGVAYLYLLGGIVFLAYAAANGEHLLTQAHPTGTLWGDC